MRSFGALIAKLWYVKHVAFFVLGHPVCFSVVHHVADVDLEESGWWIHLLLLTVVEAECRITRTSIVCDRLRHNISMTQRSNLRNLG